MLEALIQPTAPRLADLAFDRIASAIIGGSLAPGERLRDHDLADRMEVSRMPVREAIQRLERIGLAEISANRYSRVTEVSDDLAQSTLAFARKYVGDILNRALPNLDGRDRAEIAGLIRRAIDEMAGGDPMPQTLRDAHADLIAATDDPFLTMVSRDLEIAIVRNLAASIISGDRRTEFVASMRELAAAIAAGDDEKALAIADEAFSPRV